VTCKYCQFKIINEHIILGSCFVLRILFEDCEFIPIHVGCIAYNMNFDSQMAIWKCIEASGSVWLPLGQQE
jgi:hypothetical protein